MRSRQPLRRLLVCLADRHNRQQYDPVSIEEIVETVWPGERMVERAATNRVHNAIAVLRSLGLRGVLHTIGRAYALDPEIVVKLHHDHVEYR
jgi:hypothetical protein